MDHISPPAAPHRFRFRPTLLVQADLAPAVLLDLTSGHYFETNDSAHELVVLMQSGATRDELVDRLCATFAISADEAGRDVDELLAGWQHRGWLELVTGDRA